MEKTLTKVKKIRKQKIKIILFLEVVGVVVLIAWYVIASRAQSTRLTQPTQPAVKQYSKEIVAPPQGFPSDLMLEPKVKPEVNESVNSADGKSVEMKRSYVSEMNLQGAYGIALIYLRDRQNWQVREMTTDNPESVKILEAKKDNYKAVLTFGKGDGQHASVNIMVTENLK